MPTLTERENEMFGLLSEKKQFGSTLSSREDEFFGLLSEKKGLFDRGPTEGQVTDTQRLDRGVQSTLTKPPDNSGAKERIYFPSTNQELEVPAGGSTNLHSIMQDSAHDDDTDIDRSTVGEEFIANVEKQAVYLALLANTYGLIDDEDINDFIANRSKALVNAQKQAPEYVTQFQADYKKAKGFFEHGAVILNNPRALGRLIVTQAPNSILPLLTGLAGSFAGPAGFLAGTFAGGSIVEIGAWMDQEIQRKGVDMSDPKQVLAVLQDESFMNSITREAERKGLTTASVDTLFAAFGARLIKKALPGTSTIQKLGRGTGAVGVETVGEGTGEFAGASAVGRGDIPDAVLEGIAGLGQSIGQATIGLSLAQGKKAIGVFEKPTEQVVKKQPLTDTEKLQRGVDEIREEEVAKEEIVKEVKPEEITPEVIIETANKVESVSKAKGTPEQQVSNIKQQLETIGPDPATRETIIKTAIDDLTTQDDAIIDQIIGLEKLKSKIEKPSKSFQNKIDKLKKQSQFLDSSIAELQIAEDKIAAFEEAAKGKIRIKGQKVVDISLKAEERGLRRGLREGLRRGVNNIREAKDKLTALVRATTFSTIAKDNKAIQDRLIAANATKFTTIEQFEKNLPKLNQQISEIFDRQQRKELIEDIKDAVKEVSKAKNISIDMVRAVEGLVEQIDLAKPSKRIVERTQKTLDFLKREIDAGREVFLPKRVINQIERLNKIPISQLGNEDLISLLDQINALSEAGKKKLKSQKEIKKLQIEKQNKLIAADANPISDSQLATPQEKGVGKELRLNEERVNLFKKSFNKAKRKFIALTPMDTVFNMMSKAGNFKGAVFQIFKRSMDIKHRNYNIQRIEAQTRVKTAEAELNIDDSSANRILAFAELQQEGGEEKLLASGYKKNDLDAFFKEGLTENEIKMLAIIRAEFTKLRPQVQRVLKAVDNKDFTAIKDFFPMMTDFQAMEAIDISSRFGKEASLLDGTIDSEGRLKKNVRFSSTFERLGGNVPIKLNAIDVAMQHIDNATYYIHHAELLKDLGTLANTREFGKSVGNIGQEITKEWIDLLARSGGAEGNRIWVLDWLRKNTGMAVLGYKLSSALIQPTALFDGATVIGKYAFKGVTNIATSKEWRSFIANNFTEIKLRVGDDIALADLLKNGLGSPVIRSLFGKEAAVKATKVKQGAFWGLKTLDGMTASAIAAGAYEKIVTEKGGVVDFANPDQDAILEAELIVRRTQGSADFINSASASTLGKFTGNVSLDKLIFQFQTFMLTRFALVGQSIAHQRGRFIPTQESINVMTWLTLAVIAEVGIRRSVEELMAAAGGDDLDDFTEEFPGKFAQEIMRSVPVIGQVLGSFHYGNVSIPAISLINRGLDAAKIGRQTKDHEKKLKRAVQEVIVFAGEFGGLPGALQMEQIINKIWRPEGKKKSKLKRLR